LHILVLHNTIRNNTCAHFLALYLFAVDSCIVAYMSYRNSKTNQIYIVYLRGNKITIQVCEYEKLVRQGAYIHWNLVLGRSASSICSEANPPSLICSWAYQPPRDWRHCSKLPIFVHVYVSLAAAFSIGRGWAIPLGFFDIPDWQSIALLC